MKELRISNPSELRSLGRKISIRSQAAKLEQELNMSADEIREIYTQIQKIERKLHRLEYEFENDVEIILKMAKDIEYGRLMMEKAKNRLINANLRLVTVNDLVAVVTYYGLSWVLLLNVMHLGG